MSSVAFLMDFLELIMHGMDKAKGFIDIFKVLVKDRKQKMK